MEVKVLDENSLIKNEETDQYEFREDLKFEGHLQIKENLGTVKFLFGISVTGSILAKAGSGIEAGDGIEAGRGIEAGYGIITFYRGGVIAKRIIATRIAVGFNLKTEEIQTIKAEIQNGTKVILGKVETP